jgi:hypothetical protein
MYEYRCDERLKSNCKHTVSLVLVVTQQETVGLTGRVWSFLGVNPTVMGIQQLRKNSIQTHRDSSDVLRHMAPHLG